MRCGSGLPASLFGGLGGRNVLCFTFFKPAVLDAPSPVTRRGGAFVFLKSGADLSDRDFKSRVAENLGDHPRSRRRECAA